MNSRHAGPHASAVGRTVPQDPALTLSGAPGGWGRPVPGSCGSGRWWAGAGIDWPRTCLRLLLLSKSAMVKTPAVLTVGVSLCLWIFSCGGERPAADPRKVRGFPARPSKETADG